MQRTFGTVATNFLRAKAQFSHLVHSVAPGFPPMRMPVLTTFVNPCRLLALRSGRR